MKSIMYERYLSPWEQTTRAAILGGFAVVMILFFFLGTVIESRLQFASDKSKSEKAENDKIVPSVLGISDTSVSLAELLLRDYGDGSASLKLGLQNSELPIYADLIFYIDGNLQLINGDCVTVDSCNVSLNDKFVKISLRGYESKFSQKDALGYVNLVNFRYDELTGGTIILDNSKGNFSYLLEQGEDYNLLQGRKFEFPMGTYFK